MRRISKIFSFVLTMFCMVNMTAQVESVSHALSLYASTSSYDCFLIIDKGEALTKLDRIQYNIQLSNIAPSRSKLEVTECYVSIYGRNLDSGMLSDAVISDIVSGTNEDSSIVRLRKHGADVQDRDFPNIFSIGNSNQIFKDIVMVENDGVSIYVQQEND